MYIYVGTHTYTYLNCKTDCHKMFLTTRNYMSLKKKKTKNIHRRKAHLHPGLLSTKISKHKVSKLLETLRSRKCTMRLGEGRGWTVRTSLCTCPAVTPCPSSITYVLVPERNEGYIVLWHEITWVFKTNYEDMQLDFSQKYAVKSSKQKW